VSPEEIEQMRVGILVIKYQSPEVEQKCLGAILETTHWPYVLTVLDNRAGTKNRAQLWNQFVWHSSQRYLVIMDSDTEPRERWLDWMMETLLTTPRAGVVVPRTNFCSEQFQIVPPSPGITFQAPGDGLASGFCFLVRKEAFADTGFFDQEFGFYGQDSEFFVRMFYRTRWRTFVEPRAFVHHSGGYSTRNVPDTYDFAADKQRALERFFQKRREYQQQYTEE